MKPFCFSKNQIVPNDHVSLHPLDIGLIRGYAIFDFLRTVNFKPLFLADYLQRFISSAKSAHLHLDYSRQDLTNIICSLIEKNSLKEGGVRMILSGGISENNFSPSAGSLFIFCEELKMPAAEKYERGVKLISQDYVRPMATIKTTNYTFPAWLSVGWKEKNAEDVIYHHEGLISESSRSNIFVVKNGEISTPKTHILHGITRKKVMALSGKVNEKDISFKELLDADEAFMTSTTKRILPVTQIDGQQLGKGMPGKITKELIQQFQQMELKEQTPT